jgi:uncharacterized protein YbjT (DUF2867 family)
MKVVLVTGAVGFIGLHLVDRLLRNGVAVRALVRDASRQVKWCRVVEVMEGDVRDAALMKTATVGVDTVFHLAGKAHDLG